MKIRPVEFICKSIPILVLDIPTPSNTLILSSIAKNCAELYKSGRRVNNVYTIDPDGQAPLMYIVTKLQPVGDRQ
ncbi:hypothetical protein pdam_00021164 [Pocillopora damicornis]|uniref:Uncharacterized protein n=1 Tax=Pocillopora damicornis TaxID=46731 RepID=A0A3M6U7T8_POCDA|nr:hypothetical protein pdam_00021164 [Pocillopora damicornis]